MPPKKKSKEVLDSESKAIIPKPLQTWHDIVVQEKPSYCGPQTHSRQLVSLGKIPNPISKLEKGFSSPARPRSPKESSNTSSSFSNT